MTKTNNELYEIRKKVYELMDYSFEYGKGTIPMSENPPLIKARALVNELQALIAQREREAREDEWGLISETMHSANIEAELFMDRIRSDRLAQLQSNQKGDRDA